MDLPFSPFKGPLMVRERLCVGPKGRRPLVGDLEAVAGGSLMQGGLSLAQNPLIRVREPV